MQIRQKTARARRLRRDATDIEQRLWFALRELDLPHRFRRQHPIGRFIADFACPAYRLIIELDGGQHAERVAADERRTSELAKRGYRVLRFWNNEVMENLDGVLEVILAEVQRSPTSPQPSPPQRGGEGAKA
jgi:very-short-patch-repair endonuclease